MDYQTYIPSEELQLFVKCFWTLEHPANSATEKQRILPDGCIELIIHYGDLYRQYLDDGSSIIQPRSFVFGQITNYIEIEPTGHSGIIAARFLPAGLVAFLDIPLSSLTNKAVALTDLYGSAGRELEDEIVGASTNEHRVRLLDRFLLARLCQPKVINDIAKDCVQAIFQSEGQMAVETLAEKINTNRRNMERRFITEVGLSPKQLSRVVRLQATIRMLEEQQFSSLTDVALENGYYDQAHFIRDFKHFTGTSPKAFFTGNLQMAILFAGAKE